jgi:hypothetical protein
MCDVILRAPPGEIRWIISNHHLQPFLLLDGFIKKFPKSILVEHCLDPLMLNIRCKSCEVKLMELMKDNGKYGTSDHV